MDNKYVFGGVGIAVVTVLVVIGIVMVTREGPDPNAPTTPPVVTETPVPGAPSESGGPIEDGAGDDEEGEPTEPPVPPNTREDEGGDEETSMTAADKEKAITAGEAFWDAYSIRDAKKRDKALKPLVTEWLFERLSVDDTYKIPVIEAEESAVVDDNYTSGVVVTRSTDGDWYYALMAYDPGVDRWLVQRANPASLSLVKKAKEELAR